LRRFSRKRLAAQRTICDGRNDETGTQDDHHPGQRVHSVIGRGFPEQLAQQTRSDNGSNVPPRHVSDFIEEQGAAIRRREPAEMRIDIARKGSPFVSE